MSASRHGPDDTWTIHGRPHDLRLGVALLGSSALASAALATFQALEGFASILLVPWLAIGLFGSWGLYAAWIGVAAGTTRVDPKARTIRSRKGEIQGSTFVGVALTSSTAPDITGEPEPRTYDVHLMQPGAGRSAPDPDAESHAEKPDSDDDMELVLVLVLVTSDQHEAWLVGERLARSLRLSMFDWTTGDPRERTASELDEPLGIRLARSGTAAMPGRRPREIQAFGEGERLWFSWRGNLGGILLTVLAIPFGIGLGIATQTGWITTLVLGGGLPILAGLYSSSVGWGRHEIELTEDKLRWSGGPPWRRDVTIAFDRIEHVRLETEESPVLTLVTDARFIELRGSEHVLGWIRATLEQRLARWGAASEAEKRPESDRAELGVYRS